MLSHEEMIPAVQTIRKGQSLLFFDSFVNVFGKKTKINGCVPMQPKSVPTAYIERLEERIKSLETKDDN